MRRVRLIVLAATFVLLAAACTTQEGGQEGEGEGDDTGTVNVLNALSAEEGEALQALIDAEVAPDVDYEIEIEASEQFEEQLQIRSEGGTLDLILLPQPGAVQDQAASGNAVSLEDMGFDIAQLEAQFGEYYMSLGEFEGEHYGFPTNASYKSMVWYAKDDFDEAGYEIPTTFDEMLALSEQMVEDGNTPWCAGFESGTATGWPATDWIEEIILKTEGVVTYQQWATHEIPFTDPVVESAWDVFGDFMFGEGFVLGGPENTAALPFGDAPLPMFDEPKPGCLMHHQATFITAFFPEDAEAGVDYDWFPTPAINEENVLFAGELAVAFENRPEIVDFLERFSAEDVQCAMGGDPGLGRLSPNVDVAPDCYANEILAEASGLLAEALANGTGGFDAGDQMPPQVGSGSFWTGVIEYVQEGPDSLPGILEDIEASYEA